jgi:hypothetical protein
MADTDSEPDVNSQDSIPDLKTRLLSALDTITSSGKFAAFERLDTFVDPELFVPSVGNIELPLEEQTARSLIHACHRAPFGKGEETIIDTSVRKTWELNGDQFELRNPSWGNYIKQIAQFAIKELGFTKDDMWGIRAERYKLLLYEKGAMFKVHKEYVYTRS